MYVGGVTSDNDLRGFSNITSPTPIIIRYRWNGNVYNHIWGRSIIVGENYILNAISVS